MNRLDGAARLAPNLLNPVRGRPFNG